MLVAGDLYCRSVGWFVRSDMASQGVDRAAGEVFTANAHYGRELFGKGGRRKHFA